MKSVNRIYANTVNTLRNRHQRPNRGMQSRITILAICSALLLPGIAMAKKPQPSTEPGCAIAVNQYIYKNTTYPIKVVKTPSTGSWRDPSIIVVASYELDDGSTQTTNINIDRPTYLGLTYSYVNLTTAVPENAVRFSNATISATVKEPLKKRDTYRTTTCSATAQIQ